MNGTASQLQRRAVTEPKKLPSSPTKPSVNGVNGNVSKANNVASGPQKLSQVNGIIKPFDNVNGAGSEAESQSLAGVSDEMERKQPPKLKRKAPG